MIIIELIYNLSVLVAISVLSGFVSQRFRKASYKGQITHGLLFGTAAIVGILNPVVLSEGLFFDGRSIVISISAMFFGPISGLISALMPLIYRAYIGGPGVYMGISVIMTSFLIGWYFNSELKGQKQQNIRPFTIYKMGLIVHTVMIMLIYLLPSTQQISTLIETGVTIMLIYPVITVIIGKILADQESNITMVNELRESERIFRTTFYSIGDAIITTDKKGLIRQANAEAEKLCGSPESELLGKEIGNVILLLNEKTGLKTENPIYKALRDEYLPQSESFLLKQKNGFTIPVSDSVSPIIDQNKDLLGAVFVFRDKRPEIIRNNELLKSAESYRNLFNNIGGAAYVQDRQGRFIDVNDGATHLYGYPKEFFIGKTPAILGAPGMNDMEALTDHIEAAFNGEARVFEFWGIKSDGTVFPKEVHIFKTSYQDQEAIFALGYDIGLRKKAEKDLQSIQERYETLFNASPVGIILEDLDGFILDANNTACEDYGYSRNELIGNHIGIVVDDIHKPEISKNIEKIKFNKTLYTRVEGVSREGLTKFFELIETLIELPDGRMGILSISKNITEQVKTEKTLIESESRNKAILAAIPDVFFRISKDGLIIDRAAKDSGNFDVSSDEFIGKTLSDILPAKLAEDGLAYIQKAISEDKLQQFEYKLNRPEGIQWYEARMVRSGDEEVFTIIRTITDRKIAEIEIQHQKHFIETMLESIPNPLFYMDKNGIFMGVNKAFRDLYDIEESDIIGKNIYDIETDYNANRYRESDRMIFEGIDKIQVLERTIILPNGEHLEVILTKSPFPDANGEIGGLIGMITDITARKKMETELKNAKERAEESDNLKTSFLNNMNHEIRTPLNAIVGFSDLLFEDYTEEEKKSFVVTINNNSEQLLRIIDDVLSISRLDAEHLPLEIESINLHKLMYDLYNSFSLQCEQKKLEFELDIDITDNQLTIIADKGKIRQVMTGFIENAIKYTSSGKIVFGYVKQSNSIRFFVKDTGLGVPSDEQSKIFDRFYRGHEVQNKALRGNGLGLSISKGLVEIMGGTIGLVSEHGKGSEFYFQIEVQILPEFPKTEMDHYSKNINFNDLSLLIVDDEPDNLDLLFAILHQHFGEIGTARNGMEAVNLMHSKPYSVILMDIKMPVLNGFEATSEILSSYPGTLIIGQTAYSQPEEIQKMLDCGAKACIVKPIESAELIKILQTEISKL